MNKNHPNAWYSLRRTLPPWKFRETLADLLELAPRFQIDEVIVKIDTEEFSHGHPSLEWAKQYQTMLFEVKERLAELGIVYSLNPWITAGHADRGRNDLERLPGLECMVGHDGSETKHCACFLSPVWRKHIKALWEIYAETRPHIMWVEDDIRTFNHEPVAFGCFCPRHLRMFGERIGRPVERGELVRAMLSPGDAHPWRREYLEMQREIMVETASFLAKTVHAVSPETCLGLMSSGPRLHCLEGRDWTRLAEALADGTALYSRPPMANYAEDSMRGLYYSQDSIKLTRSVLPDGTIEQTECENVPFTRFSKSVKFTFLEIAVSFAYGSDGVTLNLFDHMGTPMRTEEHFGRMLAEKKAYLTALLRATRPAGKFYGVRLLHAPEASIVKHLEPGADYKDLAEDGYEMMLALECHGIATTFEESNVAALAGETARAVSDDELRQLLKGGLLLDGPAAKILIERGFGNEIGLERVAAPVNRRDLPYLVSAEEFHHPDFGGSPRKYLTATLPFLDGEARFCDLRLQPGAEEISSWVDPDTRRVAPAMSFFENREGGRVAVHALEFRTSVGYSFCHPFRREELHGVIDRLAGGTAPLRFDCDGAYALAWRKQAGADTILGVFNLNLDDWTRGVFTLAWESATLPEVLLLNGTGEWEKLEGIQPETVPGGIAIRIFRRITSDLPLVLKLIPPNGKQQNSSGKPNAENRPLS